MKYSESCESLLMLYRPGSPIPGRSTFTTSAPSQARAWVQDVPASYWVISRILIPSKAGIASLLSKCCIGMTRITGFSGEVKLLRLKEGKTGRPIKPTCRVIFSGISICAYDLLNLLIIHKI
jgi:hypothetical protein